MSKIDTQADQNSHSPADNPTQHAQSKKTWAEPDFEKLPVSSTETGFNHGADDIYT